jgi:hypothetical protein
MKRPALFIVYTSLWCLLVGPIVISIPWFFLHPVFFMVGALPALLCGVFLGLKYRSRPIPGKFFHRASHGAYAGALSTSICFIAILLLGSHPLQDGIFQGFFGSAVLGAYPGSIVFAFMPAKLRGFGL